MIAEREPTRISIESDGIHAVISIPAESTIDDTITAIAGLLQLAGYHYETINAGMYGYLEEHDDGC